MKNYTKGRLYQYDGDCFQEIEAAIGAKVPVTDEAFELVKEVRARVAKEIGLRPELSVVASALLMAATEFSDLPEKVRAYGAKFYSGVRAE